MNKKYFWSLLTFMMVVMMGVGFASCSKDDEDNGKEVTAANLKGTWELCHVKGSALDDDGKRITFDRDITSALADLAWLDETDFIDYVRYEFGQNNEFTCYINYGSGFTDSFQTKYTISGRKIIIEEYIDQEQFTVELLTDTQLVVHSIDTEEGYDVHATFKRIK